MASRGRLGRRFGQRVDLTARIRGILRDYPEGTAIFKELLQNADDASASEFALLLDARTSHGHERLLFPSLDSIQGPSLFAYNDAVFTDADFDAIQVRVRVERAGEHRSGGE